MKILSWNCRGLSNPRAIPNLRQLAQKHRPDVLFLSETLSKKQKLESIRVMLQFDSCLSVDVVGRSGGLAVLWRDSANCRIVNFSRNYVNILVEDEMKGVWRLTFYYGYPERNRRRDAWSMLRELRDLSHEPWCVIAEEVFFQIENAWLKNDELEDVVRKGWQAANNNGVLNRISNCAKELTRWNRVNGKEQRYTLSLHMAAMEAARSANDERAAARFIEAQREYNKILIQEEIFWKQRAKMHWLQYGDSNTKFFHRSATVRKRFKRIDSLMDETGAVVKEQEDLSRIAKTYFEELFVAKPGLYDPVLNCVQPVITQDDNSKLISHITKVELYEALTQMHPNKSPGPDGFNPAFYQHFWYLCGDDIFHAVTTWMTRGFFPPELNETNICLIPKCPNPKNMKDLRPISLCNVVYKLISKVLANRLKLVLDKCVLEEQSAFIEGRSILDNAMVATEIIHALKRKTSGNMANLALKIDISKAYDRVDWGFLREIMRRMGFDERWIHWLLMCVTSVHYSVLVNSDRVEPIFPGRGLRQGDPLSPYLFILVFEGLSALIKRAVSRGDIHGAHICRGAPSVSHLLFADDYFLFCRANIMEASNLMGILKIYADVTGQVINLSKSEVFFSRNLSGPAQEDLAKLMGVRRVIGTGTYLGLPSMIGRSKKAMFSFIKDRIWRRINSWSGRSLSKAGKEVMIKSVLQSIPAYIMSIYLIPDGVTEGGLGFRDFKAFNMAMVAKQGWNFLGKPNSLVSRIFKARYFPHSSYIDSKVGNNPSFVWRSLWKAKEVLKIGSRWSIGDGRSIKVMHDPWLREKGSRWVGGPQNQDAHELYVKDLFLPNVKQWDVGKVTNLFDHVGAESILKVPLVEEVKEDRLVWQEEQNGEYSVKSGYRIWREKQSSSRDLGVEGNWKKLWSISAPSRAKHLLWRICRGCLPTRIKLQQHHVICPLSLSLVCEDRRDAGRFTVMLEALWRSRNNVVWLDSREDAIRIGLQAYHNWYDWFQAKEESVVCDNNTNSVDWIPPMVNRVKCNVDAGFNNVRGSTNRGWCFRDHLGRFISAGASWDVGLLSVFEAEAIALKEAIQHAISSQFSHVTFECDCQVIVNSIHTKHVGSSEFSFIIKSVQNLLCSFPNFEVKFIKRQANSVAHTLAKAANSWTRRLRVNVQKCSINFGVVEEKVKGEILQQTGFKEGYLPFKYLGIPITDKKLAIKHYLPLIERIVNRVTHWSAKLLTYAGRLQLVQSVIFATVNFWMQCLPLPKVVIQRNDAICRSFIWFGSSTICRKSPVVWHKVYSPKKNGGMNLIDLSVWNRVQLMKLLWNIHRKSYNIWIRWIHAYYVKKDNVMNMDCRPSFS
ncbi:uncharacterized protein LOC131659630 [Vicia villosa]|uniref:uncharacterized protein LOC131659630 n=1 Tax=Vicia villosa TaxID=3911 RepID=UPI00273C9523|nr:uncharacterized protein LOC131659630 [Vicia villosa]